MSDSSIASADSSETQPIGEANSLEAAGAKATESTLSARLALGVFVAYLAVAVPLVLFRLGDFYWFLADDWAMVAEYQIGDLSDLFGARAGHWVTLPVVLYRVLWNLVGLEYGPYQLALLLTHLAAVVLLRTVMRRAGVRPWTATVAAAVLVLFGSGEPNIIWAFLIEFVGAFALGLAQLILADHDGPVDRRDWLGLGAGVLALMCSRVGVTMALVVGIATLMRRGWRVAAFHVAPLAAVYLTWWLVTRPAQLPQPELGLVSKVWRLAQWDVTAITGGFGAIGQVPGVGLALGLVLVVGLLLAWRPMSFTQFRARASLPTAMLAGAFVYVTMTGWTRWHFGTDQADTSRYLYFIAGFLLPALAVAADALMRRWRLLTPILFGEPAVVSPALAKNIRLRLGVAQRNGLNAADCPELATAVTLRPELGAKLRIAGAPLVVELLEDGKPTGAQYAFREDFGQELTVELPDLELRVKPGDPGLGISFSGARPTRTLLCS